MTSVLRSIGFYLARHFGYSGGVGDAKTHVTDLLDRVRDGDGGAGDRLFGLVYDELRGLASALYAPYRHHNTLQPTALVHEAWLKMAGHLESLENRRHFFAVAARAMRQILADRVRDGQRQKRGDGRETVVFEDGTVVDSSGPSRHEIDLIDLNTKLTELSAMNERHARVVEMRLLGTMTVQEIADELQTSKRTVESDWQFARAWLRRELKGV